MPWQRNTGQSLTIITTLLFLGVPASQHFQGRYTGIHPVLISTLFIYLFQDYFNPSPSSKTNKGIHDYHAICLNLNIMKTKFHRLEILLSNTIKGKKLKLKHLKSFVIRCKIQFLPPILQGTRFSAGAAATHLLMPYKSQMWHSLNALLSDQKKKENKTFSTPFTLVAQVLHITGNRRDLTHSFFFFFFFFSSLLSLSTLSLSEACILTCLQVVLATLVKYRNSACPCIQGKIISSSYEAPSNSYVLKELDYTHSPGSDLEISADSSQQM